MKKLVLSGVLCISLYSYKAQNQPVGLHVNDKAPEFTASDQNGKAISLKDELKKGTVVVIFYRGEWCPYCNKQLMELEDSMSLITEKGARIIAVTPEKKENIDKTIKKTKATYSIVADDHLKIMSAYKVAYMLDEQTTKKYKSYGVDLLQKNGDNGNNLPVPAVYIINQEGIITYRYFDTDFRKRPAVKELVSHL